MFNLIDFDASFKDRVLDRKTEKLKEFAQRIDEPEQFDHFYDRFREVPQVVIDQIKDHDPNFQNSMQFKLRKMEQVRLDQEREIARAKLDYREREFHHEADRLERQEDQDFWDNMNRIDWDDFDARKSAWDERINDQYSRADERYGEQKQIYEDRLALDPFGCDEVCQQIQLQFLEQDFRHQKERLADDLRLERNRLESEQAQFEEDNPLHDKCDTPESCQSYCFDNQSERGCEWLVIDTHVDCPPPSFYDPGFGGCRFPEDRIEACGVGEYYDFAQERCQVDPWYHPPRNFRDCGYGSFWNEHRGICEYKENLCEISYTVTGDVLYDGDCENPDHDFCPAGFYYNDRIDDCVPSDWVECGEGFYYDFGRRSCIAEHFCGDEEYWDDIRQQCVPAFQVCPYYDPIPCPPGYFNEPTQDVNGCWQPGECVRDTVHCPNKPFPCPYGTYQESYFDDYGCEQYTECRPIICPAYSPRMCDIGEEPAPPDPNAQCPAPSCIPGLVCPEYYFEACPYGFHREFYKDPTGCGIPGECVPDDDDDRDYCGDNYCNNGETARTCPSDCGSEQACKATVFNNFSGTKSCNYNECAFGCVFDRSGCAYECADDVKYECGNGYCDPGESIESCAQDCSDTGLKCPKNAYNAYTVSPQCDFDYCPSGCDYGFDGCPIGCTYVSGGCGVAINQEECESGSSCEWFTYEGGAYCQPKTSLCGNDWCEAGETDVNCPVDCDLDDLACATPGDCTVESACYSHGWFWCQGACHASGEECDYSYCGDGQCNAYESQANCPSDCGFGDWCSPSIFNGNSYSTECNYAYCQNGCDYNSSGCPSTCRVDDGTGGCGRHVTSRQCNDQSDCEWFFSYDGASYCTTRGQEGYCGDNYCGYGETPFSCPADCGSAINCPATVYNGNSTSPQCNFAHCFNGCDYDDSGCPTSCSADPNSCARFQTSADCTASDECNWYESEGGDYSYCYYEATGGFCGDNVCNENETNTYCPADCDVCETADQCHDEIECASRGYFWCNDDCKSTVIECSCGNNVCDVNEDETICPADCVAPVSCGNLICDPGESPMSCPSDCQVLTATCPSTVYNAFGTDNACDPGYCSFGCEFDNSGCPVGCQTSSVTMYCGNYTCDPGESQSNCPIDCGSVLSCPSRPYNGYTEFFGCDYSYCPDGCLTDNNGCPDGCRTGDFVYCTDHRTHSSCEADSACDWYTPGSGSSYCHVSSDVGGNCPSTEYNNWTQNYSCNYGLCPSGCDFDGSGCPVGCYGTHSSCDNDGICDFNESSFSCPADCTGYTQCDSTIYNSYTSTGACNFDNCPSGCNFGADGCPFECSTYEPMCSTHTTIDACNAGTDCSWDAASSNCYYESSSGAYCGNSVCEGGETPSSCPGDCPYTVSTCSATDGWACSSSSACSAVGWYWCDAACRSVDCDEDPMGCDNDGYCELQYNENYENCPNDCQAGSCDRSNGLAHYCLGQTACEGQSYVWCSTNNQCYWSASECPGSTTSACGNYVCDDGESVASCPADCGDTSGPSGCTSYNDSSSCEATTNCYWYTDSSGGYCYYSMSPPTTEYDDGTCDTDHMWNCTENECVSIGYFWCSGGCSSMNWCGESAGSQCNTMPSYCYTQSECESNGWGWCNNGCWSSSTACWDGTDTDWCGDGMCNSGEGSQSCPEDCGYTNSCPDNGFNTGNSSMTCNYTACPNGCIWDSTGCPSSCITPQAILSGETGLAYSDLSVWKRLSLKTEVIMSRVFSWAMASIGF